MMINNPQNYFTHAGNAVYWSVRLMIAAIIGLIHGVFPFLFPFYTSSEVIRAFRDIVKSKQHKNEILAILPVGWLNDNLVTGPPKSFTEAVAQGSVKWLNNNNG